MNDYLQRLVVRHYSTVPQVLPNANTYFSAGAELAASEPAPEVGTAVEAASEGVAVTAPGAGQPIPPARQSTTPAEAVHRAARGTPGTASPDVSAGLHRAPPRRSTAISTLDVAPTSDHHHRLSPPFTSSPAQQATAPPASQVGRREPPEVASVNRSPLAAGRYPILPGMPAGTPTVAADPVMPAAPASVVSSRPDRNYARVDADVAVPTNEATPPDSAAVASPHPTRSRRVVPPRVPVQAPITPASPVARLAPGRLTPLHSDSSHSDSKPAAMEIATAAGIEPTAANTAAHTSDRASRPPARHRIASIPGSAQQESKEAVATPAPGPLAPRPIAPVNVAALPIAPPPAATPSVTISIGTIEVRAAAPPLPPVVQPAPAVSSPRLSLDEYLRRRNGGGV